MPSSVQQALVLTAGLGTRLRPLTLVRAKPALPLSGEPLIRRIVRWLASQGVTDLVLNLHYKPETITGQMGDGRDCGARVRYSWEQPILGSAGGPRRAAPLFGANTFLIVNGDTLTDLDLAALTTAHAASDPLVTVALVPNTNPERYGGVRLDERGAVTGFAPRGASAAGTFHFIGVQVASAAAFNSVPEGAAANSVGDVYDRLIAAHPGSVRGFVTAAGFWDIGTVADYWRTSLALSPGEEALGRGRHTSIAPSASVRRCILWDRVDVGAGAAIEECIVTDDVRVPAGASYARSILRADRAGIIATPFDPPRRSVTSPGPEPTVPET